MSMDTAYRSEHGKEADAKAEAAKSQPTGNSKGKYR